MKNYLGLLLMATLFFGSATSPAEATVVSGETGSCIQVIQPARNYTTGECKEFPTPCDVPSDWIKVSSCAAASVVLNGTMGTAGVVLSWELTGDAPYGFKVAKSAKNLEPTYPVQDGDSYIYLSEPAKRLYKDTEVVAGKTYYYRVCIYNGNGVCDAYSNAVSVRVPVDFAGSDDKTGFTDVRVDDWYADFVADFVARGIIDGYTDGTFRPGAPVNRAEMAKIIALLKGGNSQTWDGQVFCDVPTSAWYHSYVMSLYYKDIVGGFTGGDCATKRIFAPSRSLTRAEALKVILGVFSIPASPLSSGETSGFSDVPADHWVAPYARIAFKKGIIKGFDDGTFRPEQAINRAEFVKMLAGVEKALGL